MISGSCLCGTVTFEYREVADRFVLCHCNRCRKFTGSAFFAALTVRGLAFKSGAKQITSYEAPVLHAPPPYRRDFCARCGSPVPWPTEQAEVYAVPAGCLDDAPGAEPDAHIWVNCKAPWYQIDDKLPRYTDAEYVLHHVKGWDEAGEERAVAGYRFLLDTYPQADAVVGYARARLAALTGRPG